VDALTTHKLSSFFSIQLAKKLLISLLLIAPFGFKRVYQYCYSSSIKQDHHKALQTFVFPIYAHDDASFDMYAESASKQQTYNYTQKEILDHMIHDSKILDQRMNPVELKELEAYYWNLQYIHGK
jgi:hypothetical protein